jgi:hypothetical protein
MKFNDIAGQHNYIPVPSLMAIERCLGNDT